nr:hypothetical protein OG999_31170 [Streptomyces sp. NBC_00886]
MDVPLGTVAALTFFREPLIGDWLLTLQPAQLPLLRAFLRKSSRRAPAAEKPQAAADATPNSDSTRAADQSDEKAAAAKTTTPANVWCRFALTL